MPGVLTDINQNGLENKLPDIAKYDSSDQVRNEEACTEELFATELSGNQQCQKKCYDIDQNHGHNHIDQCQSECLPEAGILKYLSIVRKSYKRL